METAETYLENLRNKLKEGVALDLKDGLDELRKYIRSGSPLQNEVFHLFADYNQVASEYLRKTIGDEQRLLRLGRIRDQSFSLIDRMGISDINEKHDPAVSPFLKKDRPAENPSGLYFPKKEKTIQPPILPKYNIAEKPTLHHIKTLTIKDAATLKLFPRVYRELRSIEVRNDKNDERIGPSYKWVMDNIADMEKCRGLLVPIRDNLNKIRFPKGDDIVKTTCQLMYSSYLISNEMVNRVNINNAINFIPSINADLQKIYDDMVELGLIE